MAGNGDPADDPSDPPEVDDGRGQREVERLGEALVPRNAAAAELELRGLAAEVSEAETQAGQAGDDRDLRNRVAKLTFWAICIQVGVADIAFLTYGFWNGWNIPGSTISAWLGATVIQVIGVGLVIVRSLFPPKPKDRRFMPFRTSTGDK